MAICYNCKHMTNMHERSEGTLVNGCGAVANVYVEIPTKLHHNCVDFEEARTANQILLDELLDSPVIGFDNEVSVKGATIKIEVKDSRWLIHIDRTYRYGLYMYKVCMMHEEGFCVYHDKTVDSYLSPGVSRLGILDVNDVLKSMAVGPDFSYEDVVKRCFPEFLASELFYDPNAASCVDEDVYICFTRKDAKYNF